MTEPQTPEAPRYPQVVLDVTPDEVDAASALLFELGAEGIEERDQSTFVRGDRPDRVTLVASFATELDAAGALASLSPEFAPRASAVVGDSWRDAWKAHFRPFRFTERIVVRPPWERAVPEIPGDIVLELEPGRAFGTGLHASTRGVARALEARAGALAGATVLDVGTGSGILLIAAAALGASRGHGVDIDADALGCARENAARNAMTDRLSFGAEDVADVADTYDFVLANIEAGPLIAMAPSLIARMKPGGALILAGVLDFQASRVTDAFGVLALEASDPEHEWITLVLRRPG